MRVERSDVGLVGILYFGSGTLGLIYEVTFSKYLGYVFGATAYASSAVLVAFMAGLALGATLAGRLNRRLRRPLLAYGIAELAVGVFCELTPLLFARVSSVYVEFASSHPDALASITVVRAALAMVVVLVPAAGMGATLPLLARFVEGEIGVDAPRRLARLYAANTFGGAVGSLASAYVILPALGLARTMHVSAAFSLLIGVIAIVRSLRRRPPAAAPAEAAPAPAATRSLPPQPFTGVLVLAAASGLLVFASEVVFTHLLALVIGTSAYAFGLMLAIFLVCLAGGAPIATWLEGRYRSSALAIGLAATGLALALSLSIWDKLPPLFILLGPVVRTWPSRELVRCVSAFFALAVPVLLMGTTFPLLLRSVRATTAGADVGRLTAANTIGSILGSLASGFILLPNLGSERALGAIAIAYVGCGVFAALRARPEKARRWIFAMSGGLFAVLVLMPKWNLARLTNGANVYFDEGAVPKGTVETISEDVHGGVTTIVRDDTGLRTLLTNGKFEGNDGPEMQDNAAFAHLPALFAEKRSRALVIGLGTGTSAGTLAAYDFGAIDIAELSPAIARAARTTFANVNHHVLDNPRTHLLFEDGRNHLLVQKAKYDVVSIELTSIWFAGAANLYNREFYELVQARLEPGGVLQQWIQLHHTNRRVLATVLNTVRTAFPHVLVAVVGHQGVIIASQNELKVSHERMRALEATGYVKDTLKGQRLLTYARGVILDERGVDALIKDVGEEYSLFPKDLLSTDDNLRLEYETPKGNVPTADGIEDTIARLMAYRPNDILRTHVVP